MTAKIGSEKYSQSADRQPGSCKPNRAELIAAWAEAFGKPPPKGLSTRLLDLAISYEAQVEQHAGLSPKLRKRLAAIANGSGAPAKSMSSIDTRSKPSPGTRLLREWHGRTHVVDVLDHGVSYDGRTYRSLSQVARAITGARWSGPRFFGL